MEMITVNIASVLEPVHNATKEEQGYVCAQVNPSKAAYTGEMIDMAKRLCKWAPNIAVKLPATAAGLDALEECVALGMTITATVSFTLPQVLHIANRYKKGTERARLSGINPGKCFAVIMIGRIDDYLRDVSLDMKAQVKESDIRKAGIAVLKRAYSIFEEEKYEAVLLPAGMRGEYHATELSGAKMIFSIHPSIQKMIYNTSPEEEERIEIPVETDVIDRLMKIPEFVRAYNPDGMKAEDRDDHLLGAALGGPLGDPGDHGLARDVGEHLARQARRAQPRRDDGLEGEGLHEVSVGKVLSARSPAAGGAAVRLPLRGRASSPLPRA